MKNENFDLENFLDRLESYFKCNLTKGLFRKNHRPTKELLQLQHAFTVGYFSALDNGFKDSCITPAIYICLLRGESILSNSDKMNSVKD